MPHIVAPLSTAAGALWIGLDGYALSLYPFVDGRVGGDVGLSDGEWRELGLVVRRFHSLALPPGLARIMPRETFTPSRRDLLPDLEAAVDRANLTGPAERELAAFWHSRRDLVHPDLAEETRLDAVRGFMGLFEPGQIVDIALTSSDAAA